MTKRDDSGGFGSIFDGDQGLRGSFGVSCRWGAGVWVRWDGGLRRGSDDEFLGFFGVEAFGFDECGLGEGGVHLVPSGLEEIGEEVVVDFVYDGGPMVDGGGADAEGVGGGFFGGVDEEGDDEAFLDVGELDPEFVEGGGRFAWGFLLD